jgi:hypothetical protein
MQMSDLYWSYSGPIASLSQQSTASLSCDPIQSFAKINSFTFLWSNPELLNNPQLHFLVIQSKAFSTIHSFTFL